MGNDGSVSPFAYGYKSVSGVGCTSVTPFTTLTGGDHSISSIVTAGNSLIIGLESALSAIDKRTVALHVCDQAYAFKSGSDSGSTYTFTSPSQNWFGHAERMVYLSQDTVVPTFVEARINGTSLVMTFSEDLGAAASLANGAFTVKNGMGTTQTLGGTTSISDSTVTLTLATAVANTDTGVKVSYTKPMTGTANKVVDKFGNEVATFGDQDVNNALADSTPPEFAATDAAVLAADGLTLTLTFNEALKASSVPATSTFTVEATPAGGSEAESALASSGGVTVSGSTVALKLAIPIAHNDGSVKVSYAKPGTGSVIEDANGNDAAAFADQNVTNSSTIPRVSITAVYPDATPGIAIPRFTLTCSLIKSSLTVWVDFAGEGNYTNAGAFGNPNFETHTFRLELLELTTEMGGPLTTRVRESDRYLPALPPNNVATVQVKVPSSGLAVAVTHQQDAYSVTEGDSVTVGTVFTTAPIDSVAQPRSSLVFGLDTEDGTASSSTDYDGLSETLEVRDNEWTAAGTVLTATKTFTLQTREDDEYEGDETITLRNMRFHNVFVTPALVDHPPGAETATVTIVDDDPLGVSNIEVTSTTTGGYYDISDTIQFNVEFNGAVTVTGTPQFAFELGGQTRQAWYLSKTPSGELVFTSTIYSGDDHDGISWVANSLGLNGGTIKFMHTDPAKQVNADLSHPPQGALPSQKVDTTKPSLALALGVGATLTMTFTEALNTAAPATSAFTVRVGGGTGTNPTAVTVSGRVVTLTMVAEFPVGQTVTVSYAKPSTNPIKDLTGRRPTPSATGTSSPRPPSRWGWHSGRTCTRWMRARR